MRRPAKHAEGVEWEAAHGGHLQSRPIVAHGGTSWLPPVGAQGGARVHELPAGMQNCWRRPVAHA